MKAVILAGGGGTRLWPLSQQHFPKQFIKLQDEHSLFQKTVLRLNKPDYVDSFFVITNADFKSHIEAQLAELNLMDSGNIINEPLQRNTAPAIALAAKYIETVKHADLDDVLLLLPSDHMLEDSPELWRQFALAKRLAKQGYIVTFGVVPTHPETGYGYIKTVAKEEKGKATLSENYYPVEAFLEKPDLETATRFVASEQYLWNSGMFAFTIRSLYDAFAQHAPEIARFLPLNYQEMYQAFAEMPNKSFDYAVMEKTVKAMVVPLSASWSDVGSWDSIYNALNKDTSMNAVIGQAIAVETRNSLVINKSKRVIATLGVQDLVIIDTPGALLIAKQGETQKVRHIVERLKDIELTETNPDPDDVAVV